MATQGTSGAVDDPSDESADWRNQLQRQWIVNKLMDMLKRHLPFSEYERLQELKKIAERVEDEIYNTATNQSEYTDKTCFMILTMETRLQQSKISGPVQSNLAANGRDWQEEVFQKIKAMEYLYNLDLSSQVITKKIKETLKRPLPYSGDEGLKELKKLTVNFKDKVYATATSHVQQNLLQRDMQQRFPTTGGFHQQNVIDQQKQLYQQPRAMPKASSTSLDSTAQTGNPNGGDWQEEVYQKIKAMKHLYLLDLSDMHHNVLSKLHQHDSLPQQSKNEQFEKLKKIKNLFEHFMRFLQIPKHGILANHKAKLDTYEKHLKNITTRKPNASLDSTAQTGNSNGGDWQEEVHQKIESMKGLYLLDLSSMHQKILSRLHQQQKNEIFEKLKVFKNLLERFMQFLQTPKHGILANHKDNLDTYEKHIKNIINSNRRKPAPPQQQAQTLPPPHMQQSHDQVNLQGSMQTNNMGNMQQNRVALSGGPTVEAGDWRDQLEADSRERIMNTIFDTLKKHLPFAGLECLQEIKKISERFEEKKYATATSQSDYLRNISLKLPIVEVKNPVSDQMQ